MNEVNRINTSLFKLEITYKYWSKYKYL